jgi:predicted lipid-binding transport protein (Tim44 family)
MNPMAGRPMDAMQRQAAPAAAGMAGGAGFAAQQAYSQPPPLQLSGDDFNSFEKLLHDIQMGYGREDIGAIRALSTPEMAAYMEGDMRETEEKGLVNRIANVKLLQGDLAEAWREPSGEYATVAMRYAISDALVDRKTGRAVEGDLNAIGEVTEIWTFVRQPGDAWKLSAIQQTAPAMA